MVESNLTIGDAMKAFVYGPTVIVGKEGFVVTYGRKIRIAIAGVGNCCKALAMLIQMIRMRAQLGGPALGDLLGDISNADIEVVAAFDIGKGKVGEDFGLAVSAWPNNTNDVCEIPFTGVTVQMGPILDGVSERMRKKFRPLDIHPCDVVKVLKESGAQILLNYMPVGARTATKFYARAAIEAGCAFINCMPAFVVKEKEMAQEFTDAKLVCCGDDIMSGFGASFLNRNLLSDIESRGCLILSATQENSGSNTDFENMQDEFRLEDKHDSKENAVLTNISCRPGYFEIICNGWDPSIAPDNKLCDIDIQGLICNTPFSLRAHLHVVDSYNSATAVWTLINLTAEAISRGLSGPLIPACAYFMKSPPVAMKSYTARRLIKEFIADDTRTIIVSPSRTKHVAWSGNHSSEHWTSVCDGIKQKEEKAGRQVEIMSPRKFYHNGREYVSLVREAVRKLNDCPIGYKRKLILSFSVTDASLKRELIEILNSAVGVSIYGVDAPADQEFSSSVRGICGHIGIDERALGRELLNEVPDSISNILVIRHQNNNYTLDLRIEGIKEMAEEKSKGREKKIGVVVLHTYQHRQIKSMLSKGDIAIITLGNRGTEKILGIQGIQDVPLVCVDTNERIMSYGKAVTWFDQKNLYGGHDFSGKGNSVMSIQKATA